MGALLAVLPFAVKIGTWFMDRLGVKEQKRAEFLAFMQSWQEKAQSSVDLRKESARQMDELRKRREARESAIHPEVKP